jgi:hypothetical protein
LARAGFSGFFAFDKEGNALRREGFSRLQFSRPESPLSNWQLSKDQFEPTLESSALDRRDLSLRLIGTANAQRDVEAEKQIKKVRR